MFKKILIGIGLLFVFPILLASLISGSKEEVPETMATNQDETLQAQVSEGDAQQSIEETKQDPVPVVETEPEPAPTYTTVYTKQNYRSDGAVKLWILIEPVDVSSDAFKADVENVIRQVIKEKGAKISLSIFDQRSTLDLDYKQYGDLSLGRARTEEESAQMARHAIAVFDGEFGNNFMYPNELSYFPGAFKNTPEVGQYVATVELK